MGTLFDPLLVYLQRFIDQKVGAGESVLWTQQQIERGFTGCIMVITVLYWLKYYSTFAALLSSTKFALKKYCSPLFQKKYCSPCSSVVLHHYRSSLIVLLVVCYFVMCSLSLMIAIENLIQLKGCAGKYATGDEVQLVGLLPRYSSCHLFFRMGSFPMVVNLSL
jgi:hypothetical protein